MLDAGIHSVVKMRRNGKIQLRVTSPPLRCGKNYWRVCCDIEQDLYGYTELKNCACYSIWGFFAISPPAPKDGTFLPDFFLCVCTEEPFHFGICQTGILWGWKILEVKCFSSSSIWFFLQADFFFHSLIKQIFLFTFPVWIEQVENRYSRVQAVN